MKTAVRHRRTRARALPPLARVALVALSFFASSALAVHRGPDIWLPDSFAGNIEPRLIGSNPANGLLYVIPTEMGDYIIAIDPVSGRRVARIPLQGMVACGLAFDSTRNWLFCATDCGPGILVVDCTRNEVIDTLAGRRTAVDLYYDGPSDRLYFRDEDAEAVGAVGVASGGSFLWTPVGDRLSAHVFCSGTNRLFCGCEFGTLVVYDCGTGSIIAQSQDSSLEYVSFCLDEDNGRVWALTLHYTGREEMLLIAYDALTGVPVDSIAAGAGCPVAFCYNPAAEKLYCVDDYGYLRVANAVTGEVSACGYVGAPDEEQPGTWLCVNPRDNRVYCFDEDTLLTIVDGETDNVRARLGLHGSLGSACYDPLTSRVYGTRVDDNVVDVIDGATDSLVASIVTGYRLVGSAAIPAHGKLYVGSYAPPRVLVLDLADGNQLGEIAVSPCSGFWGDEHADLVYNAGHLGQLDVIDCAGDSILATLALRHELVACCPSTGAGRAYFRSGQRWLLVYDCASASFEDSVFLHGNGMSSEMAVDPALGRAFCTDQDDSAEVVDLEAGVAVARLPAVSAHQVGYDAKRARLCLDNGYPDFSFRVFDGASLVLLGTLGTCGLPVDICADTSLGRFYCVAGYDGGCVVYALDALTGSLVDSSTHIGFSPRLLYLNEAQRRLWCLGSSGEAAALDPSSLDVQHELTLPRHPVSVAATPDGSVMYVTCWGGVIATIVDREPVVPSGEDVPVTHVVNRIYGLPDERCLLYDASGRGLKTLCPRTDDVSGLAPGVYFVRSPEARTTRKVVVVR